MHCAGGGFIRGAVCVPVLAEFPKGFGYANTDISWVCGQWPRGGEFTGNCSLKANGKGQKAIGHWPYGQGPLANGHGPRPPGGSRRGMWDCSTPYVITILRDLQHTNNLLDCAANL